ncbi:MAG TPA: tetratricopeptide repeat protein [bacterium]|nr:tetratricopeptide repeat protein [bacterium]
MKRFLNVRTLAFPAAALLAVVLSLVLRPGERADVAALARTEPLVWQPTADESVVPRFQSGLARYREGDWSGAAADLSSALSSLGNSDAGYEVRLYLGICLLQLGRPEEAAPVLQHAGGSVNRAVSEHACWYRAQAHIQLGQVTEARTLLNELSRTSAPYARPASEQLLLLRGR